MGFKRRPFAWALQGHEKEDIPDGQREQHFEGVHDIGPERWQKCRIRGGALDTDVPRDGSEACKLPGGSRPTTRGAEQARRGNQE
jgi:hypothetical protein